MLRGGCAECSTLCPYESHSFECCLQRQVAGEHGKHADASRQVFTDSATLAYDQSSPLAEAANHAPMDAANGQLPVTFSNSSNSSACCMPTIGAQAGPSYDINASARTAEQLLRNHSSPEANMAHYNAAAQGSHMPAGLRFQGMLPSSVVQSLMASVFDDVDSGRHQQAESESAQHVPTQFPGHRRGPMQQDSLPSAYRSFFPADDLPSLQYQQQLRQYQLAQLLPPQLQERQLPQHAHQQHAYQQPSNQHQHQQQRMGFSGLTNVQHQVNSLAAHQMPSDMQQWPSPVSQRASPSNAAQAPRSSPHTAAHNQIKLEDLDLSGLKRDYSSFTGPTSQPRQPKPAPRRALSFTQGSPASAASTAAIGASAAGRHTSGGASSSQAGSSSRLSTPGLNVTSPPDTDASLSDSDEVSGSDSGGVNIKRRRVVKGKRGEALAMFDSS